MKYSDINTVKDILKILKPLKNKIGFKGGTSLFVRYDEMNRRSLDIDIMYIEDSTQDEIVNLLRANKYVVTDPEEGYYGVAYNVTKLGDKDSNVVAIDLSKYIVPDYPKGLDDALKQKPFDRLVDLKYEDKEIDLFFFHTEITFFEKVLAISSNLTTWNTSDKTDDLIRKVRHLDDICRLFKIKDKLGLQLHKKFARCAQWNEINSNMFGSINHWGDLAVFKESELEKVRDWFVSKYNDEYENGDTKMDFDEIVLIVKEIHKLIGEFKFDERN